MTAPVFPVWNGENHNELGLVRRMSRSAVGGFAPLRVVEDLDDQAPARAGFNLLGQVVSVLPLHDAEQVSFAKLSRTTRDKQADQEKEKENAFWARLPRLTAPGLDIDPRKDVKGTAAGKAAATAIARKLIGHEHDNGIGLRASWSGGGGGGGGIHLDWRWTGELVEVHLLRALKARTAALCLEHGIPTSETKTETDLAWVDLAPLNHGPGSRGRLWRPLGGKHKRTGNRKALIGWPQGAGALGAEDLAQELAAELEEVGEEAASLKRKRRRRSPLETVAPIIPIRQAQLGELRAYLAKARPSDGEERQRQRMAWAAALLLDGIRERDVRWVLAKAIGNARATARIVTRTRELIESGSEGHGGTPKRYLAKPYLERKLGTAALASYGDILGQIRTKETKAQAKAIEATGGLSALVHSVSGLSKNVKASLVAHSELLRDRDPEAPAIGGLLRPSICRAIHEWITCSLCKGERGRRRIACEDEMCAHCHRTRILHEHDLAAADWQAKGVGDVLLLSVDGFATLADSDQWVRERNLARQGLKVLKVRTLEHRADEEEGRRIKHGIRLAVPYKSWNQACLQGAAGGVNGRPELGQVATVQRFTATGAAEALARARWRTHIALRTAATRGELEELTATLGQMFRRRAASSGKGALSWPGRTAARESIAESIAAKKEAEQEAEAKAREAQGVDPPKHGETGHQCEGCPAPIAHPVYNLMSSGAEDAEVVHSQRWKHQMERAWQRLAQRRRMLLRAEESARASRARSARRRLEDLARVPF